MVYTITQHQLYCAKRRIMSAEDLRIWMGWHGLSQVDVAKATKVNRRTVYNWLNEVHEIPRSVWPSLAQQFGAPLPRFIEPAISPDGREWVGYQTLNGTMTYSPATEWPQGRPQALTKS